YRQALQIKIEVGDRYWQASTYHQLGVVAREQRRWGGGRGGFLTALGVFAEAKDGHNLGIGLSRLARVWGEARDLPVVSAIAAILGAETGEIEELLAPVPTDEKNEGGGVRWVEQRGARPTEDSGCSGGPRPDRGSTPTTPVPRPPHRFSRIWRR